MCASIAFQHGNTARNGKFDDGSQLKFQVKQTFVFANGEVRVEYSVGCD